VSARDAKASGVTVIPRHGTGRPAVAKASSRRKRHG
jgi:hypothetical protein